MEPPTIGIEPNKLETTGIKTYSSNSVDMAKSTSSLKMKQMSWASIASQPVKLPPKSLKSKLATTVLSATKHVPPSIPPSSPPPSISEDPEAHNSEDQHYIHNQQYHSSGHHDAGDSNGSREMYRPSQPTPEPTPAQAAEIIERQKKEQSQQNRDLANLKHNRSRGSDTRNDPKSSANTGQSDVSEAGKIGDTASRLSGKSSLNSSINSHRSIADDSNLNVHYGRQSKHEREHLRENRRDAATIGSSSRDRSTDQHHSDNNREINRDFGREVRDYPYSNRDSRDHNQSRDFSRTNNRNTRDFYGRNDTNRRHERWDEQSNANGRDNSRDRRDNREQYYNRPEFREYRDNRREYYGNRAGKRYNDEPTRSIGGSSSGSYHSYSHSNQSSSGRPMYGPMKSMNRSGPAPSTTSNITSNNNGIGSNHHVHPHQNHRSVMTLSNSAYRSTGRSGAMMSTMKPSAHSFPPLSEEQQQQNEQEAQSLLDKLGSENNYNPSKLDTPSKSSRFFIIKSYSEDDVHRSIKYSIWCSTEHGNAKLDAAYRSQETLGPVYLLYSVNGSGHFCGVAQMLSPVDYGASSGVWSQDKWKGQFRVKWIYVKDVPNQALKHIILANNEYKPVTYSRDTQEVPHAQGCEVLDIIHNFAHSTSIFDDFLHYEKKQLEEQHYRQMLQQQEDAASSSTASLSSTPATFPTTSNTSSPPPTSAVTTTAHQHQFHQSHHNQPNHNHYKTSQHHPAERNYNRPSHHHFYNHPRTIERAPPSQSNRLHSLNPDRAQEDQNSNEDKHKRVDPNQHDSTTTSTTTNDSNQGADESSANDDHDPNVAKDTALSDACFKLSLQSTVWADQWD